MSKLNYKQSGHNKYSSNDNKFTVPYLKLDDKLHKFSIDGTKGTSKGVAFVFRETEEKREQLIKAIQNVY